MGKCSFRGFLIQKSWKLQQGLQKKCEQFLKYWCEYGLVQLIKDELEPNDIAFIVHLCLTPEKVMDAQNTKDSSFNSSCWRYHREKFKHLSCNSEKGLILYHNNMCCSFWHP